MIMTESAKAFERYKQIADLLDEITDKKGLRLVQELVEKCANYVRITEEMEEFIKKHEIRDTPIEKYQQYFKSIDERKRLSHNALISQLSIVNRYLFKHPVIENRVPIGGIYSLDPNSIRDRNAVGDWAYYLIDGLTRRGMV